MKANSHPINDRFDPLVQPWIAVAVKSGRPVFPLTFVKGEGGLWQKTGFFPKWPEITAEAGLKMFRPAHNGLGIVMGGGFYAIDYDAYKDPLEEGKTALEKLNLPPTRVHSTLNGGYHMFFRVQAVDEPIPNTANILPFVDGRGANGCVTFSAMHRLINPMPWAAIPLMPANLLHLLVERAKPNPKGREWVEVAVASVDEQAILTRLERHLDKGGALKRRWTGDTDGMNDPSRSGRDASIARLLVMAGFEPEAVLWLLHFHFKHGLGRLAPDHPNTSRQLARAVGFALASAREEKSQRMRIMALNVSSEVDDVAIEEIIRRAMTE